MSIERIRIASMALALLGGCGGSAEPSTDASAQTLPTTVCTDGEQVAPHEGPPCTQATHDCLRRCADPSTAEACTEACLAEDPSCRACVAATMIGCFNRSCQDEWDLFACCTERECELPRAGADRVYCMRDEGRCTVEYDEYMRCMETGGPELATTCGAEIEGTCNF